MILRFCIASLWTIIYVFLSELHPTVVRSLALGIISILGTLSNKLNNSKKYFYIN